MKRYRVAIKNSKECRIELNFPDLSVKYANGYAPSLKVKEGEEIPLDVLDPEDIRKSLKVGSLKGYMDNGWVEELIGEIVHIPPQLVPTPLSHFITEQMIFAPGMIAPLKPLAVVAPKEKEVPAESILPEATQVEKPIVSVPKVDTISDLTLVKTFEDFDGLSHFLKLRFIKDSNDIVLLKDILGKTPSVQFKNNITLRLTQIKV